MCAQLTRDLFAIAKFLFAYVFIGNASVTTLVKTIDVDIDELLLEAGDKGKSVAFHATRPQYQETFQVVEIGQRLLAKVVDYRQQTSDR